VSRYHCSYSPGTPITLQVDTWEGWPIVDGRLLMASVSPVLISFNGVVVSGVVDWSLILIPIPPIQIQVTAYPIVVRDKQRS